MAATPLIYIIAGEQSGDLLGARLMQALQQRTQEKISFAGIGGEKMQAVGLQSLFPMQDIALFGFLEIVPHLPRLLMRIAWTVADILQKKPVCVVTIDSPGFNFRIAKRLRRRLGNTITLIHYVAPTVWAYKPKRAKKIAALFDHLLVLLPFEPPYFEKEGLQTSFVGHPILEYQQKGDGPVFRKQHALHVDTPVLCMLPGSRRGEILRHMPIFMQTLGLLKRDISNLAVIVAVPAHLGPLVEDYIRPSGIHAAIVTDEQEKKNAFAASNVALAKSGTVTLELALAGLPMVATYRVNPISAWLLRRMITLKYYNLINILLNKEVIPELMQEDATPKKLASALKTYFLNREKAWSQSQEAQAALAKLRSPDSHSPSNHAAKIVLALIKR